MLKKSIFSSKKQIYFSSGSNIYEMILNVGRWLRKRCRLKVFLFSALAAMQNLLCNFGNGHYDEPFRKINFEFGPVVQEEMPFKIFLIYSSGRPFVWWGRTL